MSFFVRTASLLCIASALSAETVTVLPAIPVTPPSLPKAPEPVESILRLQLFLDGKLFTPGKVDGRPGDFTNKALKRYQAANGLPETEIDAHALDLSSVGELYTTYVIREEDKQFVGALPSQPSAQAKKKYLPYDSLLEFLTERFHTSPELITWLNRPMNMYALKPGDSVRVPNVAEPFKIEELTPVPAMPENPAYLARVIRIDTREKLLGLYEGEKLLASMPITPGSGYTATPPGTWKIVGMTQMPTFRWDKSMLDYGVRSQNSYNLPMGPNNPVGVMWIGLSKSGIGIHGTNQGQTIGRSSSHGCMRTANWDVVRLSKLVTKGMTVIIEGPKSVPRPVVVAKKEAVKPATPVAAPDGAEKKKWFQFWKK